MCLLRLRIFKIGFGGTKIDMIIKGALEPLFFLIFIKMKHLTCSIFLLITFSYALAQELTVGVVLDTVKCLNIPAQTYALYLPTKFSKQEAKEYALLMIFEPAARGALPVKKYKRLAEKYSVVLACSNNSKNGSWQLAFESGEAVLNDVLNKTGITKDKVYFSGFSGGSRAAIASAVLTNSRTGVIACGAGYPNVPNYRPTNASKFKMALLCGRLDMNYHELLMVEKDLIKKGLPSLYIKGNYDHQWPDLPSMDKAFLYQFGSKTMDAQTDCRKWAIQVDSLLNKGQLVEAVDGITELIELSGEGNSKTDFQELLFETQSQKEYKKDFKAYNRSLDKEREYQNEFFDAFKTIPVSRLEKVDSSAKDLEWWLLKIKRYKKLSQHSDRHKANVGHRLLNIIGLHCASTIPKYKASKDYEMAIRLNKIWVATEQTRFWALLTLVDTYSLNNQKKEAFNTLEQLYQLGFRNDRFGTAKNYFVNIKSDPRFSELATKIRESN